MDFATAYVHKALSECIQMFLRRSISVNSKVSSGVVYHPFDLSFTRMLLRVRDEIQDFRVRSQPARDLQLLFATPGFHLQWLPSESGRTRVKAGLL